MKISPVSSGIPPTMDMQGNPAPSRVDSVRSLKMKVNATPLTEHLPPELSNPSINETSVAVEATQPLSPQLASLAKQRRSLQVRQREVEAREKALQSRSTENPTIDLARLKQDPLRVLLENGVTYDQLTDALLQNQGNSEVNALKAEIDALKKGIDQKFTEKDAQQEQQIYAEMRREAEQLAKAGEDFELVRETRSVPTVLDLIKRTYASTGEVLDVSEAMKLVEDELLKDMEKLTRLKKLQGQMNPLAQAPQSRQVGMRTLTNKDTASPPMSAKQRAMAAFYGTLKR